METPDRKSGSKPLIVALEATFLVADCSTPALRNSKRLWVRVLRVASGTHALALADQAVVSGASFLSTVLIGRWILPSQLGLYSMGMSLLISFVTMEDSLITLPYSIRLYRLQRGVPEQAGAALVQSGLLSAVLAAGIVMAGLGLSIISGKQLPTTMSWALASVTPFLLLREFGRQFAFAHLQTAHALIFDSSVAAIQITGLGLLGWTGRLSAVTAYAPIGLGCALAGAAWLYLLNGKFLIRIDKTWATIKESWNLGRWLFASQITLSAQGYIAHWMLALLIGTTATGIYAACMSVVSLSNPVITGLTNLLLPRAALVLQNEGRLSLRRQMVRDSLLLGTIMSLFCLVVIFNGEQLISLLYHERDYRGHQFVMVVLAFGLLAAAMSRPASGALASMERPHAIFWTALFAASLTFVTTWYLMGRCGILGAAYGLLVGNIAGAVGRWIAFLVLVRQPSSSKGSAAIEGGDRPQQ